MTRHLAFAAIGSGVFFLVTLLTLLMSSAGVQVEGYLSALESGIVFRNILVDVSIVGALAGGIPSLVFRHSTNQRLYVVITLVLTLIFLQFVLLTILRAA